MKIALSWLIIALNLVFAQYRNDSSQYELTMKAEKENLKGLIESHPDVNLRFYPERALIDNSQYVFSYPVSADYRIGLLMDPCRFNSYNCCMNIFGTPEYPALLQSNLDAERVFKYVVIAQEDEVSANYYKVYEDSSKVNPSASRMADDESILNKTCVTYGDPDGFCQGRNYAFKRSALRPPCMDNNASLNATDDCIDPKTGKRMKRCVQVGFTSNAFIPQCGVNDNDHCGTYLEIHMPHGTPYTTENDIIGQSQLVERNVSGYYTTTINTTWMGNSPKVLCSYAESTLRINSTVYIQNTAPVCCCPQPYQSSTRIGSFQCPIGATGYGAFAHTPYTLADILTVDSLSLAYPFCPIDLSSNEDRIMYSAYDYHDRRHFARPARAVAYTPASSKDEIRMYTSGDLLGRYDDYCPYYPSCALTLDLGKCRLSDLRFTFIGRMGLVTKLDNEATIPQVWVTFNNGRTEYQFAQTDVILETNTKSTYELWWVVRSKSEFTVQKRKGFNVTSPSCTFDTTNNRYFPYAILDANGDPLADSVTP